MSTVFINYFTTFVKDIFEQKKEAFYCFYKMIGVIFIYFNISENYTSSSFNP